MSDLNVLDEDAGAVLNAATGEVKKIPVVEVKADEIPVEQAFYFIAEKDESTNMYSLSMPFDSLKRVVNSGLINKRSTVVKFSIPL